MIKNNATLPPLPLEGSGEASTICALATAPGGAIAVIRVSGDKSFDAVSSICAIRCKEVAPNTVHYTHLKDGSEIVDECMVSIFRAPHSYTGEDAVEISCHGSQYKEGQMYHCEVDDFYLIPTAEVPVTNIYRDVILDEAQLPIKNCAYTECFRREAGSYGKDVRGLNRLHEFSKIEIVRIDKPEHSKESHKEMLEHVEGLLKKLELPYRILLLCGGDQSFTSSICYDFEVYSEAQKRWLEVSSVSNFDTYQANRLKCRYRRADNKKIELCHTLNGSALALPRIVAALLENNQTEQGIKIPAALVPYTGFEIID